MDIIASYFFQLPNDHLQMCFRFERTNITFTLYGTLMNKNSCYAFYGSLRRGMFNYQKFKDHLEYLFTENLPGFRLHAMDHYPMALITHSPNDIIRAEIMRVTDASTEKAIHDLEIKAGYYYDEVTVRGNKVGIYLFRESGKYPLVPGGDWIHFFRQKE